MSEPSKTDLVQMVDNVMKSSGCMMDVDGMLHRLEALFPGVDIGTLIFDPPSGKKLTAEEIVEHALNRKR